MGRMKRFTRSGGVTQLAVFPPSLDHDKTSPLYESYCFTVGFSSKASAQNRDICSAKGVACHF
jgi:hypothetical protein